MTRNSYIQSHVPLGLQAAARLHPLIDEVNSLRVYGPSGSLDIEHTNRDRKTQFRNVRPRQVFNGQPHRKVLVEGNDGLLTAYYEPVS